MRLGAGKVERGRAEDEWDWELPRSGGEEEPHEPTSHVSREPSLPSRQLPAGRRPSAAGGPGGAGRGTLRTRAQGTPKALGPSLRQRPGRRRVEMGGAGGEALPRAAARPFQGEVLLWGAQSLSPPGQRGLLGRRLHSFCLGPTQSGCPSPSSPPFTPPRLASAQRPRRFNWPLPDSQGRPGTPALFQGLKTRPPPVPGEGRGFLKPAPLP